jgi:hypothetical protein
VSGARGGGGNEESYLCECSLLKSGEKNYRDLNTKIY